MSNPQYPQGGFPDGQNPGPQDPGQPQGYPGEQQYPSAPPPASAASASGGWGQTSLRPIQGAGAQPVQPGPNQGWNQPPVQQPAQQWGQPPTQLGYGQQPPGYPPVHHVQAGGQPARKKNSTTMIIGLIVLGILAAAGIGALISSLGGDEPEAPPTVVVTPAETSTSPTTTEVQTPSPTPTSTPTEESGTTIDLQGVVITVPPGWKVATMDESKSYAQIVDADGNGISLQTFPAGAKVSNVLVDEYLAQQMAKMTDPKKYPVKKVNMDPAIDVSEGSVSGTRTTSSGSMLVGVNTVMSVRGKDKLAFMSTLVYNMRSDVDKLGDDYNKITNSGLRSHAAG